LVILTTDDLRKLADRIWRRASAEKGDTERILDAVAEEVQTLSFELDEAGE